MKYFNPPDVLRYTKTITQMFETFFCSPPKFKYLVYLFPFLFSLCGLRELHNPQKGKFSFFR